MRRRPAVRLVSEEPALMRLVATMFGACFLVGAGMEAFMIKTGFYAVATRKEAERRALAQWEREEAERLKEERTRRALGQAKAEKEYSRMRLTKELQQLRSRERETGVKLDDEKAKIKLQLKLIARIA